MKGDTKSSDSPQHSEVSRLQATIQNNNSKLQELTSSNTALQSEIHELRQLLTDKESVIRSLSDTIQEKNYAIQQKNGSIQTLSSTIEKYKQLHDESWLKLTSTSTVPWKIDRSLIRRIPQRSIGKGAWGEVYSATFHGKPVAIKYVYKDLLQIKDTVEMIKREIGIMAHIQHPNLVGFIGAVVDKDVDSGKDVP